METIKVCIGTVSTASSGIQQDSTRAVEFVGEKVTSRTEYGLGRHGGVTETRGVTETLYRVADDRLVVYVEDWSKWQREPNTYTLHGITESDLQPNGRFGQLGYDAGYGRPLTLDEALATEDSE